MGDGPENTTTVSAAACDIMELRQHLLQPAHASPPLVNPAFVHVFSGMGGLSFDNMSNSPAGREMEASLQTSWAATGTVARSWTDPLHRIVEQRYPGASHHLHVVHACAFGDGFAASEGLHCELFQMRLKRCGGPRF